MRYLVMETRKQYSKAEVVELADQVLGVTINPKTSIPDRILESLGLHREWTKYFDTAQTAMLRKTARDARAQEV